jgi:hypothetical protein
VDYNTRGGSIGTCHGYASLWLDLSAAVWTGLISGTGSNNCGLTCPWRDMSTGQVVGNVNAIAPCSNKGDGDAFMFVNWNGQGGPWRCRP